jgi:hypothetical protein
MFWHRAYAFSLALRHHRGVEWAAALQDAARVFTALRRCAAFRSNGLAHRNLTGNKYLSLRFC